MFSLAGNSLWQLVRQSDFVSQLVLLILLVMSMICWSIFLGKLFFLQAKKRSMRDAARKLAQARSLDDLLLVASEYSGLLPNTLLSKQLLFFKSMLETDVVYSHDRTQSIIMALRDYAEQQHEQILAEEESYMGFLSTSAAVAPLLGLFGTIWGLIHAFVRISQAQTTDIAVVAPGIAEALITTLAGLLVAIPAMAMYNLLLNQMRTFDLRLLTFVQAANQVMERVLRQRLVPAGKTHVSSEDVYAS
jgi:biopolymer transport protein TolQ